jgi:predicted LPLAT superfamily acyltransferase
LSERYNSIQAKIAPDMNRVEAMKDPAVSIEVKRAILAKGISPETLEMGKVVDEADKLMKKINKAMKTATPEQRTNLLEARQRAMKAVIRAQNTLTPD